MASGWLEYYGWWFRNPATVGINKTLQVMGHLPHQLNQYFLSDTVFSNLNNSWNHSCPHIQTGVYKHIYTYILCYYIQYVYINVCSLDLGVSHLTYNSPKRHTLPMSTGAPFSVCFQAQLLSATSAESQQSSGEIPGKSAESITSSWKDVGKISAPFALEVLPRKR